MHEGVCLIVPVKDEADNLRWLLPSLTPLCRTVVVDNDSKDASAEVARALGAEVVRCPERGVGRALQMAASYLRDSDSPYGTPKILAMIDADGSFVADDLAEFLSPITQGSAHIVFSRVATATGDPMPWPRRAGQGVMRMLLSLLTGRDPMPYGTLVACDYDVFRTIELEDRTWGWLIELKIKSRLLGLCTAVIDVPYHHRQLGRSKVTRCPVMAWRVAARILWAAPYYWLKSRALLRALHWSRVP